MLTEKGKAVVRAFEGRALKAYRDSVGVWTIGYGITNAAKWAVAYLGKPIGAGMVITEAQAEFLLEETYKRSYEPAVLRALPGAPSNVTDAGGSFHWNTGAISRAGWCKAFRERGANGAGVHSGLRSWAKAGGKELKGLVRRREREWAIVSRGDYGPEGVIRGSAASHTAADAHDHPLAGTPGMLRLGDASSEVGELNADLIALGFDIPKGDRFSPATDTAVRKFQEAHPQLSRDGVVGPASKAAIKREADAKRKITKAAVATGGPGASTAGIDQMTGGHLPLIVYVAIGVAIVAAIGWFVWKYRDELRGLISRATAK